MNYFNVKTHDICMKFDDEGDLNRAHMFPRVLGYKRSDITEDDITEV